MTLNRGENNVKNCAMAITVILRTSEQNFMRKFSQWLPKAANMAPSRERNGVRKIFLV